MQHDGPHSAITPRTRARARHILDHYYIGPARNADVLEIWGYTPDHCYSPGDEVALHVSTTADTWSLEIGRDGPTYECVMQVDHIVGQHQDTPTDCSINGCDWQESMRFTVPETWRPGGYLMTLRAKRGDDFVEEHHLILIRNAPAQKRKRYLLVCATGTG